MDIQTCKRCSGEVVFSELPRGFLDEVAVECSRCFQRRIHLDPETRRKLRAALSEKPWNGKVYPGSRVPRKAQGEAVNV